MFLKRFSLFFDHQNWQYFYPKTLGFLEWETQIQAGSERVKLLQAIIVFNFKETVWSKLNKMVKKLILGILLGQNSGCRFFFFFFKYLASSVTRYYSKLSSCTISEKNNDPILRKLGEGWMDGRTDRQQTYIQTDRGMRVIS